MTSNVNNRGIAHLAFQTGGQPLCRSRRAHIVVAFADAARWGALCKRCEAKLARINTKPRYSFNLRRTPHAANSLAELSAIYCRLRDESGEGASTFPMPIVFEAGRVVGHMAYNGRIFEGAGSAWTESTPLLYENRRPRR